MGKVTATEEEVYKWLYETLDRGIGLSFEPDEFIVEYFENSTGLKLPKKWEQSDGLDTRGI